MAKSRRSSASSRMLSAAAVGALSSLIIFFNLPSGAAAAAYRISAALAMSAAAFAPCGIKTLIKGGLAIAFQSLIVSGAVMLWQMTADPIGAACCAGAVYFDIGVPALIVCSVLGYMAACLITGILSRKFSNERFCDITLLQNGTSVRFTALIDTGNSLVEPFSGYPVIVCELSALKKAVPNDVAEFDFEQPDSTKIRLVPYKTLDSSGLLPSFFPERVYVKDGEGNLSRVKNCCVAVTTARLGEEYRAICNPNVLINNEKVGDEAYERNG